MAKTEILSKGKWTLPVVVVALGAAVWLASMRSQPATAAGKFNQSIAWSGNVPTNINLDSVSIPPKFFSIPRKLLGQKTSFYAPGGQVNVQWVALMFARETGKPIYYDNRLKDVLVPVDLVAREKWDQFNYAVECLQKANLRLIEVQGMWVIYSQSDLKAPTGRTPFGR